MSNRFKKIVFVVTAVAVAFSLVANSASSSRADDIVGTASSAGKFNTLVAAVKAAGLVETLQGDGPFTVFAPTDEAFAKIPSETLEALLKPENRSQLQAILTFHVVPGKLTASEIFGKPFANTANGQRLSFEKSEGRLTVNGSGFEATDIDCSNGVIHVIDTVMLPEAKTIPEIAQSAGVFNTLLAAVTTAELGEVLSSEGPFTVFAPTDEAFAELGDETIQSLLQPENREKLINLLKYHVVAGRVYSDQAIRLGKANTLLEKEIEIDISGDGAFVNESRLVQTDIQASNGVIHVISKVLVPQQLTRRLVRATLEEAVRRGSSRYNMGRRRECAQFYETACRAIVEDAGPEVSKVTTEILRLTLIQAEGVHDSEEKCWVLRHGIDLAYASLRQNHVSR